MGYNRVKKTKTMAKVFSRKSGEHKSKKHQSRTKQKQQWKREVQE